MATKQIGLGTVVKVNAASITIVVDCTPPARVRADIDQTALDDTLATVAEGIEEASKFMFTQYWHPGDSVHEAIDTLFNSKEEKTINIVYPFTLAVTDAFGGVVCGLEPETVGTNGIIRRKVTINRKTDITRTTASP